MPLDLVPWVLVTYGVTLVVTASSLLAPLRDTLDRFSPFLGELVHCPMCTGWWVGLSLGLAVPSFGPLADFASWPRAFIALGDAFAASASSWVIHVTLERLRRE